ncbi:tranposase, partial [Clostridium sulfidigenes]
MSNKFFTEYQIKNLSQNKYVQTISSKSITYTDEFKRHF